MDENLYHTSYESGMLEDPMVAPLKDMFKMVRACMSMDVDVCMCGCVWTWMGVVSNENDNIPALITPNHAHAQIKPVRDRRWTPRTPPTRPRRSASSSRRACPSRYAGRYECLYVCVHISGLEAAIEGPPRMATLSYTHPYVNAHKPRW